MSYFPSHQATTDIPPNANFANGSGKYIVGALCVGGALLLKLLLQPLIGEETPFLLFFIAVLGAAWSGNLRVGLFATFLSVLASSYFFLEPIYSFVPTTPEKIFRLTLFALEGALISLAVSSIHTLKRSHERGFSKVLRDDTEHKHTEDELRRALRRLDFHVSNSPLAVIEWDGEFRISRWAGAAEQVFGWTAEEVLGRRCTDWRFIYEPDLSIVIETNRALVEGISQPNISRNRNYTKDERVIHCEWYNSALLDEAGKLVSVLSLVMNVTERDEARVRLEASEERYRAFVAQSSEGIWRFELREPLNPTAPVGDQIKHMFAHGYLAECNDAMAHMYGFEHAAEIIGTPLVAFINPEQPENIAYLEAFIRSDHRLTDAESIETDKNGETRYFLNNLVGIIEDGALRRAWGTQRDVTERGRAEAERAALLEREQAARAEAEAANRMKDEFLATLSHELRTPLTPIIGWVHLLRGGVLPATKLEHGLDVINRNATALSNLINDLLDMSAIQSGKLRLKVARLDLVSVLRQAIETSRATAQRRLIEIELVLPPDADARPLTIDGDPVRLVQVFWHLLNNAIKFSPDGERIIVRCERDARHVTVHVEDRGVGVEPEFLPYVFNRFRQADQTMTRPYGGLGLGLALAKSVTEAHSGSIAAASSGVGRGSCFTVQLPLMRDQETLADERMRDEANSINPFMRDDARRILIVDDVPDTLEMLRTVFEQAGFAVIVHDNAHDVIEAALNEEFACLIADIGMPGMDGYQLLRTLHAEQRKRGQEPLPALALTGYASSKDAETARAAGFTRHLAKPIDPTELFAAVDELLTQTASHS